MKTIFKKNIDMNIFHGHKKGSLQKNPYKKLKQKYLFLFKGKKSIFFYAAFVIKGDFYNKGRAVFIGF